MARTIAVKMPDISPTQRLFAPQWSINTRFIGKLNWLLYFFPIVISDTTGHIKIIRPEGDLLLIKWPELCISFVSRNKDSNIIFAPSHDYFMCEQIYCVPFRSTLRWRPTVNKYFFVISSDQLKSNVQFAPLFLIWHEIYTFQNYYIITTFGYFDKLYAQICELTIINSLTQKLAVISKIL